MRRLRVKELHDKCWNKELMKTAAYFEDYKSEELSAAHFIKKYLESVSSASF